MYVTSRQVEKFVPVAPGMSAIVRCSSPVGTKLLTGFTVQSIAKTDKTGQFILVLTKASDTLLIEWNTDDGEVKLNYINGSVKREDFEFMQIRRGARTLAVTRELTFLDTVREDVKEPIAPGVQLTTHNAKLVVEYVCEDGSIVFRSQRVSSADRNKIYPTKTILVGPSNPDFWRAVHQTIEWEGAKS